MGIPHPQYGVMRATVMLTDSRTLTHLAAVAQLRANREHAASSQGLPHLYVGKHAFVDTVGDARRAMVVGVLVFVSKTLDIECAPMALVNWHGMWLPYFEDRASWVVTGWDRDGWVTHVDKPFGWDCQPLLMCQSGVRGSSTAARGTPAAACSRVSGRDSSGSGGCGGAESVASHSA